MGHASRPLLVVALALSISIGAGRLTAQSQTNTNSVPPLAFEIASVKPNKAGPMSLQRAGLSSGERVTMINVPMLTLLQIAYPGMTTIVGAPKWVGSPGSPNFDADRFDVNAKADSQVSVDLLRLMLRTLLADRFKLAIHIESRPTDVYALRLARADGRLGSGLRPAAVDCRALIAAAAQTNPTPKEHPCGTVGTDLPPWHVRGVPIGQLAAFRGQLGRPIVDKTGLTGPFDIDFNWAPPWVLTGAFDRSRFPTVDPTAPDLFTAMQEQLGLKLVSEKDDQSALVIDHVEPPTPD
jgi:uncharacterized protein (TIGR03435 family)